MPIEIGDSTALVRSKINAVLTDAGLDPADNVDTTAATNLLNQVATLWSVDVTFVDRMPEAEFRAGFELLESSRFGPELVTNGNFDTDLAGWSNASTAPSTVVWSGGAALWQTNGLAAARLRQSIPMVVGQRYRLIASGTIVPSLGSTAGGSDVATTTAVSIGLSANGYFDFTAASTTTWINTGSAVNGLTFDAASVRQVLFF